MRSNEETKSTFEQHKQNDNEVLTKRSTVSLQKGVRTLSRRATGNASRPIGWLALSLLLFNAPLGFAAPRSTTGQLLGNYIVLTGGQGWNTMPFGYFGGIPTPTIFNYWNPYVGDTFGSTAAIPGVQVWVAPSLNFGSYPQVALLGVPHSDLPLASWNWANDSWGVSLLSVGDFTSWASEPGVRVLAGDFNGDGKPDIALVGGAPWTTVPVAFSNGDGTFKITNFNTQFASMAAAPGVQVLVGDFNGDGTSDIALVGGAPWTTVPVAFSNGNGTFTVTNKTVPAGFATFAAEKGVRALVGNFTNQSLPDIALVGGPGWNTLPIAHSNGDGAFMVSNTPVGAWFQACASTPGVQVLVGDFNGDFVPDIALVGALGCSLGWSTIPVALGGGTPGPNTGYFNAVNVPAGEFATWAAQPGVKAFVVP